MNPVEIEAILSWVSLLPKLIDAGGAVYAEIKTILTDNGIDHDTTSLDAAIADADRRKSIADAEAK
jgi:hypothetical protein